MGGNFRQQYVWRYAGAKPMPQLQGHLSILVALSVEADLVQHLLRALRQAFPDGGLNHGIDFMIKPHPMCPVDPTTFRWPATFVEGKFEEALQRCVAVLYSGSGTGMEALAMGRVVLRYRSELLLNIDHSDLVSSESIIDCGDKNLREKVLSLLHAKSLSPLPDEVNTVLKNIFPQPDAAAWLEAVERLCAKPPVGAL
jgi:hypothetical protein